MKTVLAALIVILSYWNEPTGTLGITASTGADTIMYTLRHDSLWDSQCNDRGQGCTYFDIVYPVFSGKNIPLIDTIRKQIVESHTGTIGSTSEKQTIRTVMKGFIEAYRRYAEENDFNTFPWFVESRVTLVANTSQFVCLEIAGYSYTGGAHGNARVTYHIFSNPSGEKIDWRSLFNPEAEDSIRALAEQRFREDAGVEVGKTLSEAGFWFTEDVFILPDNVGVCPDGIIFYYNNYEIAPYVYGPTRLVIPFGDIRGLIPPDSPITVYLK